MFLAPAYFESYKRMKEVTVKQEILHTFKIKLLHEIFRTELWEKKWLQLFVALILSQID